MTWLSTRIGYRRKSELGLAERREGRDAWQVAANLAVATAAALVFASIGGRGWLVAAVAALAEAATDTVASEVGQSLGGSPRLITTGKRVATGTDGGVTIPGTVAGLMAGCVIAAIAFAGGILFRSEIGITVGAGFIGMLADSLLGATAQRRGWLSNQGVNLIGSLAAALLGLALVLQFHSP
jgi:uncharacterized protein (TIGR00297 family)